MIRVPEGKLGAMRGWGGGAAPSRSQERLLKVLFELQARTVRADG